MPMNLSASLEALASSVIGRVEVLVAWMVPGPVTASTARVTSALMPTSSNTASTIRSQPERSS